MKKNTSKTLFKNDRKQIKNYTKNYVKNLHIHI